MKNLLLILFLIFSSGFIINFNDVYGHGVGSEIFPPVELNGKLVSVEVSSSTKDDIENDDQQISISLIDFDSKIIGFLGVVGCTDEKSEPISIIDEPIPEYVGL